LAAAPSKPAPAPILGIIANPASGKDVRRLVARASVFDNQEKRAIVVRALTGAAAAGVRQVRYFNDKHGICVTALNELAETNAPTLKSKALDVEPTGNALDTIAAARAMKDVGCGAVLVLGGDGTSRAFTLGWRNATLMPLSTGTNNVFPHLLEATVAGTAVGLIATRALGRRVARAGTLARANAHARRPRGRWHDLHWRTAHATRRGSRSRAGGITCRHQKKRRHSTQRSNRPRLFSKGVCHQH